MKHSFFEKTKGGLVVSCQALHDEPLHSSFIMGRMAYAAKLGGAVGIRCNTVSDITEIKKTVDLPLIAIIKQVYGDSPVYITPTIQEVDALVPLGVDVIAIDATARPRPDGRMLAEVFPEIRAKYPDQLFMADCATFEDGVLAEKLGFDIIGTTMTGCTAETKGQTAPNIPMIEKLAKTVKLPMVVEGGIWSPEKLAEVIVLDGVHCCVVGSAITRPMEITKHYVAAIPK